MNPNNLIQLSLLKYVYVTVIDFGTSLALIKWYESREINLSSGFVLYKY